MGHNIPLGIQPHVARVLHPAVGGGGGRSGLLCSLSQRHTRPAPRLGAAPPYTCTAKGGEEGEFGGVARMHGVPERYPALQRRA